MDQEILTLSKIIRDYHHVNHQLEKSDLIMVLWSHDIRVADRWIELFKQWFADAILFSGWVWRLTNDDANFVWTTEAEKFAAKAIEAWIPAEKIIIENKSTNTWENIRFSFELIKNMGIKRILLVQKPYMERRTFATFSKQWPWENIIFYVTSPQISFEDYPNEEIPMEKVIDIMVWDLQRISEYPKMWFQIPQEVPTEVMQAYERLVELWFTKSLIL